MVKSIAFTSVDKSSFGCGLDNYNGTELSSSRMLDDAFSDTEEVFAVTLLMLVSFK